MHLTVKKGESLFREGELGSVWRVERGVVLLQKGEGDRIRLIQVAIPGDLLGLESLCQGSYAQTATALVDCRLTPRPFADDVDRFNAVARGYMQQQERMLDMASLRTGPVSSRVKCLLHLLGRADPRLRGSLDRKDLPTLREMSQIMDITRETICRELASFFSRVPSKAQAPDVDNPGCYALAT